MLLLAALVLSGVCRPSTVVSPDGTGTAVCVAEYRACPSQAVELEPGFPVQTFRTASSYRAGPGIHTLVGEIDGDVQAEILVSGLTGGEIYAWNHDGSPVPGWPLSLDFGTAYPALGFLSGSAPVQDVFMAHFHSGAPMAGLLGNGSVLPGWPRAQSNYVSDPAAVADIDADGIGEVFICEERTRVHGYRADGTVLPGWPVTWVFTGAGAQGCVTPSIADLDQDGALDVVTVTEPSTSGAWIIAVRGNGTALPGFPIRLFSAFLTTYPAIGDVDGDGEREIVLALPGGDGRTASLHVYSGRGELERIIDTTGDVGYGSAPSLADLDDDGLPEIIMQSRGALYVHRGSGDTLPGWPQVWGNVATHGLSNSAPAVGDANGDGKPDILVVSEHIGGFNDSDVRLYNADGTLDPRFPFVLPLAGGAAPAIVDMDLDGRNELIITGVYWNGFPGWYDKVWAYDLGNGPHGRVEWGQFKGGPEHRGVYPWGLTPLDVAIRETRGNGNGLLEPGELATIVPRWRNLGTSTRVLEGSVTEFTGPGAGFPVLYRVLDGAAAHGTVAEDATTDCEGHADCYAIHVGRTRGRPVLHWDASMREELAAGPAKVWRLHVGRSFADVDPDSSFYPFVETVLHHGVTTGCGEGRYCPGLPTTRAQVATFVLVARQGAGYVPPECTGIFSDVPVTSPACPWIEELARRGVVRGCASGRYCPGEPVTRQEMAVILLQTLEPALNPPACTVPPFTDVAPASPFCRWIAELARREVVSGCGGGKYCPGAAVSREEMAVFVSAAFGLELYGP